MKMANRDKLMKVIHLHPIKIMILTGSTPLWFFLALKFSFFIGDIPLLVVLFMSAIGFPLFGFVGFIISYFAFRTSVSEHTLRGLFPFPVEISLDHARLDSFPNPMVIIVKDHDNGKFLFLPRPFLANDPVLVREIVDILNSNLNKRSVI